jgi:hypothetical protein
MPPDKPPKPKTHDEAIDGVCSVVRGLLASADEAEVTTRHHIGAVLSDVQVKVDTYGLHAMERVAERLGISVRGLYQCVAVADTWNAHQLQKELEKLTCHSRPLSWSHMVALTTVPEPKQRNAIADECRANAWSVRELLRHIEERSEKSRPADAARPGEEVRVALREAIHVGGRALADVRAVEEAIERRMLDADASVDETLLTRALRTYEELVAQAQLTVTRLREASPSRKRLRVPAPPKPLSPEEEEEAILAEEEEAPKKPRLGKDGKRK